MNSIEAPEKEGYVFMGWYDEDGNVFDFENKIDKNMILIAHYGIAHFFYRKNHRNISMIPIIKA